MSYKVTEQPASEPIVLADAKNYLKQLSGVTTDDDLITSLIVAARKEVEQHGIAVFDQEITESFDSFPQGGKCLNLSLAPLRSVTSIQYLDTDGATQTLSSSIYTVDDSGTYSRRIALNEGESWPSTKQNINAVTVVYRVGFDATAPQVETIKTAMQLKMAYWYMDRADKMRRYNSTADMILKSVQSYG